MAKSMAKKNQKAKARGRAKAAKGKPARAKAKAKKVSPIPKGFRTVTPHLILRDTAAAIEWYKRAFGAKELSRMEMPGGKIGHAEIRIGDSIVMMADEFPEMGQKSPETLGGTAAGLMVYVKDVDKAFAKAVEAGAKTLMPVADQFWGDRYGQLVDPFGHKWSIGTHIKDLTPKQMKAAMDEWMAQQQQQQAS